MLAIIEACGKQYEVEEGRFIDVELLDESPENKFEFDKVVMIAAGEKSLVGQPYVEGAIVKTTIVEHGKEKKILIYKQKRKKGYRVKQGHRQQFTRVMVDSIDFPDKSSVVESEVKKPVAKKTAPKAETKKPAAKKAAPKAKATEAKEETKSEE